MKVIVVGSKDHGSKNDPAVIAAAVEGTVVYWEDVVFHIKTNDVVVTCDGKDIFAEPVGLVMATGWYKSGFRDVAYAFGLIAKSKDIPLWNSEIVSQRSTTKLSCMVQLALEGVSVPETIYSLGDLSYISDRSVPFIAKAAAASRGQSNFLIGSQSDRQTFLSKKHTGYLVQPFMPNDHDLRVICFGGEPQLVLKRSRAADSDIHLNNTSQGGSAEWLDLSQVPAELLTVASKICKIMSREMAGIDFIPDHTSPYQYSCLEVNAIPQLTSGVDVEIKMTALQKSINRFKERT